MTSASSRQNSVNLLHLLLQGQTCLLFQVYLNFLVLHSNPLRWKRRVCVCVCVCGVVGLHGIGHLHFFDICDCGIDLDYCDVECFALETK